MATILDDSVQAALVKRGRFVCQPGVDNRGDYPDTAGLQESLLWPDSPQFEFAKGEFAYNFISGPPGNHFPNSLRDCVLNFATQIAPYVDGWLTGNGMPSDYDGWVHDDIEKWDCWNMNGYNGTSLYTDAAATYPHWSFMELFAEFRKLLHAKIRELRPNIKGIAVYGLGNVNVNYMIWDWDGADAPNYRNRAQYMLQASRFGSLFRSQALGGTKEAGVKPTVPGVPFYDVYWDQGWNREDRKTILLRQHEVLQAVFGRVFSRYAFCYLPIRSQRPSILWEIIGTDTLREMWSDALALGYRHFAFWDALESAAARDDAQTSIETRVAPVLVELGGTHRGGFVSI